MKNQSGWCVYPYWDAVADGTRLLLDTATLVSTGFRTLEEEQPNGSVRSIDGVSDDKWHWTLPLRRNMRHLLDQDVRVYIPLQRDTWRRLGWVGTDHPEDHLGWAPID